MKYRTLGRKSSARQALLRSLVTSLIRNETLHTTWPKAKEAQRLAEKLITYAKKDNETTRRKAQAVLYVRPPSPDTAHTCLGARQKLTRLTTPVDPPRAPP